VREGSDAINETFEPAIEPAIAWECYSLILQGHDGVAVAGRGAGTAQAWQTVSIAVKI